MKIQHGISKFLALALAFGLCVTPEMFAQQQAQTQTPATAPSPQPQGQPGQQAPQAVPPATSELPASTAPAQTAKPSPNGTNPNPTTIDPSQGPLQPVTTYPDATGAAQPESSTAAQQT